jgi:hypothetical protein
MCRSNCLKFPSELFDLGSLPLVEVPLLSENNGFGLHVWKSCKEGWIWLKDFQYMYEYGTWKPVEVILRRGVEGEGE